jgi:hypothetical protein
MAGNRRSSTLHGAWIVSPKRARDGRESPLKYTGYKSGTIQDAARDGRESPLKYTRLFALHMYMSARDGRESPLKYTEAERLV